MKSDIVRNYVGNFEKKNTKNLLLLQCDGCGGCLLRHPSNQSSCQVSPKSKVQQIKNIILQNLSAYFVNSEPKIISYATHDIKVK